MERSTYIILFFVLLSADAMFAQGCEIRGRSLLSGSDEKAGNMIQLLDTTNTKLIGFRTTDDQGEFKFSALKRGYYKIRMTQFGYADTILLVHCNQAVIELNLVTLMPLSVNLEEVSVIDKAFLMRKSGDTTIFNIKAFETGSEQSVTDMVMKISGFSTNGSQYLFQNRPVQNVLIDGRDISDANHVEFTDAISYETIQDLRIIENYSDTYQPYAEKQEKGIALEIKLKEKFKQSYQGTVFLYAGYNNIHDAGSNIINTKSSSAFRLFVAKSNSGRQIQEFNLSEVIRAEENNMLFNGNHRLVWQHRPHEFSDFNSSFFSRFNTLTLKIAADNAFTEKFRMKSSLQIHQLGVNQNIASLRQYFTDAVSDQDFVQLHNKNSWVATLHNNLSAVINSTTNFEFETPVLIHAKTVQASEGGSFSDESYQNESNQNIQKISIAPVYKFHKIFKKEITLSVFGTNRFSLDFEGKNISSKDTMAGQAIFDLIKRGFITDQNSKHFRNELNNQLLIRKKYQNIDVQYNISFDLNSEKLSNSSEHSFTFPFVGMEKLEFSNISNSFRLRYDTRLFRVVGGIIHSYVSLNSQDAIIQNNYVRPKALVMYRISNKWNVSSSFSTKISRPSLVQVNNLQTLQSQWGIREGGANISDAGFIDTYNLSVFKEFEISERATLFNAIFSFSPNATEVLPVYHFDDYFQTESHRLLRRGNQVKLQLLYYKKFGAGTYNINLLLNQSNLYVDEAEIKDKTLTSAIGFNYNKIKNITLSSGIDLTISQRENASFGTLNVFMKPKSAIRFEWGLLQGKIWYQLTYNEINGVNNTYHDLNMELIRKKTFKYFECSLKLYDILNLAPSNVSLTTLNPVYIQTNTYRMLPGQILLGIKWYFSPR